MATQPKRKAGAGNNETVFFCLITMTAKGRERTPKIAASDRNETTTFIRELGGTCELYQSTGAAFAYISIIRGITSSQAIEVAQFIEQSGNRIATMLPAFNVFK